MSSVIYDGLTEKAFIAAVPRLHGEMRFKFRPPTTERINRFLDSQKKNSLVAVAKLEAEAIAANIVEWDLVDPEGQPLPITKTIAAALQPSLFVRVKSIVIYGAEGGDIDPADEAKELADANADSVEKGLTLAQIREERDVKN